ncbi:MAG: hypothetical protein J6Q24_00020 [Clostridia bacterium]|nr:hypothetical protein [Clostridia bacterium]
MYSREFGEGIRSEGNLRDYMRSSPPPEQKTEEPAAPPTGEGESIPVFGHGKTGEGIAGGLKKLLQNVEIDDLILIGIGILLLLDSDTDNDTLIILILLLLFF